MNMIKSLCTLHIGALPAMDEFLAQGLFEPKVRWNLCFLDLSIATEGIFGFKIYKIWFS